MSQSPATASPKTGQPVLVLTGGGSGGHITPLLSLARALKEASPGCEVVYVGHKGDKFDSLQAHFGNFDFAVFINAGKFRRYHSRNMLARLSDLKTFFLNVRDFFRLFSSTMAAYRLLGRMHPDVVFSKGGFVGIPVGLAAKIRGIPIVTHDSDAQPGLSNKIIGRWAKINATGMPPKLYAYPKNKIRWVGIPVDDHAKLIDSQMQLKYKKQIGVPSSAFVLLISGGGLGAKSINDKIISIASKLLSDPSVYIFHIAGQKNEEDVQQGYASALDADAIKRTVTIGFSGEFYKYVGAADLIVSRAGATSLAEFAVAGKACIIIPSPFLSGGHQLKNAGQLKAENLAEVVDDDASPKVLLAKIDGLKADAQKRRALAERLASTAKPDAAKKLAELLLDVAVIRG